MIKINRGPTPSQFNGSVLAKIKKETEDFYSQPSVMRNQKRFSFDALNKYIYPSIREVLASRQHNKCAYCEIQIDRMEIDHFRPKGGVSDNNGEVHVDHYWWLAFEWNNYYGTCRACNSIKGGRFPINGQRAKIHTVGRLLLKEKPLLLDPAFEDPARQLLYQDDATVVGLTDRAKTTIDILQLNRQSLVEIRKNVLSGTLETLELIQNSAITKSSKAILDNIISDSSIFCAMTRQFVAAWAKRRIDIEPSLSRLLSPYLKHINDDKKEIKNKNTENSPIDVNSPHVGHQLYRHSRYIQNIEISNIGSIDHLVLEPSFGEDSSGSWLVLLGENGVGKTTVLRAIALALIGTQNSHFLGFDVSSLVRQGCRHGEVRIQITGLDQAIVLKIDKRQKNFQITPPTAQVMCLAYGATRLPRVNQNENEGFSRVRVENLFNPYIQLSDGRPWLFKAGRNEFNIYAKALLELIPHGSNAKLIRKKGEIYLLNENVRHPLTSLSSGYQAVVALAMDIMEVMRLGWKDMTAAEGIVLIDEIDAHLHPRWKMRIVPMLRKVFPRIQFIATSHDPLTLRSLDSWEVAVLAHTTDGITSLMDDIYQVNVAPKYMTVDQILKSDLFGLFSTIDTTLDESFDEYYRLLSKKVLKINESEQLRYLKTELHGKRMLGNTPRETMVLEAADEYLAERRAKVRTKNTEDRDRARTRLKELWSEMKVSKKSTKVVKK